MSRHSASPARGAPAAIAARRRLSLLLVAGLCSVAPSTSAIAADRARISALSDVSFGVITNFAADSVRNESLCLYSKSPPSDRYRITASGSGSGGAFELNSGSDTLPYEVEWSDAAGQATGTSLLPNQPLTAQQNTAGIDDCSKGPATTASLVIVLRSAAITSATSGNYTGTLSLLVAPE